LEYTPIQGDLNYSLKEWALQLDPAKGRVAGNTEKIGRARIGTVRFIASAAMR
jgi:hypothetical protein